MCAFVSVPARLHSVSVHACTWSTFKPLYLQPGLGAMVCVCASEHLTVYTLTFKCLPSSAWCVCACAHMCVSFCLTIFISIFSPGTDPASQHLDMFATGATVELVDPVVSSTHGVSHLCLVFHMHAEVDPIHTKYLLGAQTQFGKRRQLQSRNRHKHAHYRHTTRLSCSRVYALVVMHTYPHL